MQRTIVFAVLLAIASAIPATPTEAADTFGWQMDCTTHLALNAFSPNMSESSRVRRAVDSCMSRSLPKERMLRVSANTTLVALEERRESLVDAVLRRMQLCRDVGMREQDFATSCPQLFRLEPPVRH